MPRSFLAPLTLLLSLGCELPEGGKGPLDTTDTGLPTGPTTPTTPGEQPGEDLSGFIGSPCETDADCDYEGGVCLREGFPGGTCSTACTQYCDDLDGHPYTFCAEGSALPAEAAALGDGACLARCDFAFWPQSDGCRPGYGCVVQARANEPETETFVCLPDRESELPDCYRELAARGVAFEPTVHSPESPDDEPGLSCTVRDALRLYSPFLGVELRYVDGSETTRVYGACELGHALADTVDELRAEGVDTVYHYGTYNCRVISGTDELSRHAYGDAIDFTGFGFEDGTVWTLVDHWEHDTTDPESEAAQWLYDTAYLWYDTAVWNIVLTPNYNSAHDDHFHVDLTPGSEYIGFRDLPWLGENPSGD